MGLLPQINAEDGETLLWGHYMALLPLSEAEMSDAPRGDGPSSVSPPVSDSWDSRENRSEDPSPEETVWVPAFESGGFAVARGALQTGYVHLLHKVVSYDEANEARLEPCVGSADDLIPLEVSSDVLGCGVCYPVLEQEADTTVESQLLFPPRRGSGVRQDLGGPILDRRSSCHAPT